MSTPPALLGFFQQEATEYLDRLDQLLAGDGDVAPDGASFLAQSRALRGAATMTRLGGLAEFTSTLERIAAGWRDGELHWDQRLHFAVRGALQELRALVAMADRWTDAQQRHARTQSVALATVAAGYLASLAPAASPASPVIPIARLFPSDGAPGLVERNLDPPVTLATRFRGDMAAAADGVARESANLAGGERGAQQLSLTDALRRALLGLADVAESYGATSIAGLATRMARSAMERPAERVAIQAFAQQLMDRDQSDVELAARVREQAAAWPGGQGEGSASDARTPRALPPVIAPLPATPPAPTAPIHRRTPAVATAVAAPVAASVATPDATPVATPVAPSVAPRIATPAATPSTAPAPDAELVPIETLLYSGEGALARARAVRDELRVAWQRVGGTALDPATSALLDELSDLLDLASAR